MKYAKIDYEKINKELKAKKVYGFEFKGFGATDDMKKYVGKIGEIRELHGTHPEYTKVVFHEEARQYYYPTKELEDHLVDVEPVDLDKLFNEISRL